MLWLVSALLACTGKSIEYKFNNLTGMVMLGYQGWFGTADDGCCSEYGWRHWSRESKDPPSPHHLVFDLWPDLSEYPASTLFSTQNYHYANGTTARLYSPYVPATLDLHFKWLSKYGLDGIFAQRFIHDTYDQKSCKFQHFWRTFQNIKSSAAKYSRAWAIRYDLSGYNSSKTGVSLLDALTTDWKLLVNKMGILNTSEYLRHAGRPVVVLTGIGMADKPREPSTVNDAIALAKRFQSMGCFIIAGTGYYWRDGGHDSHAGWQAAYNAFDGVQPWSVGRYHNNTFASHFKNYAPDDLSWLSSRKKAYGPVIWPGFSWHNLKEDEGAVFNEIPRFGGEFFQQQASAMLSLEATYTFVAQFDEVNEGTAMFKAVSHKDQTPVESQFLYLSIDGVDVPSDHYLRLCGDFTKAFHDAQR